MFKTFSRISACAALAVSFFLSSAARAQDLTVTIPSLNDVQTKVAAIAGKINPTYPMIINMTLGQSAAFGIDPSKPIAVYVDADAKTGFSVSGFIPVKSQKMFDAQIEALKEKGLANLNVESKDGYSILLFNKESAGDLPKFNAPKMLNFSANPTVFVPFIDQQIAAAELLQDEEQKDAKKLSLESMKESFEQLEKFAFSLDASDAGALALTFGLKPVEGSDLAANYTDSEKLSKSALGVFCDKKAPFSAQFLGAFDENTRKKAAEFLTSSAKVPGELADVVLKALDVKKFDFACSFYPDKKGIYGALAMGIANGEAINAAIVKAIEKINEDSGIEGKANAGTIGKLLTVHEFTVKNGDENQKIAVAVSSKYLFLALAPAGNSAVNYLKGFFKEGLKAAPVEKKAKLHFNMELLSALTGMIGSQEGIDYVGELNYAGDFANGALNGTLTIDGDLMETIGKISSAVTSSLNAGDDDDDDLFGDDDDDDDDDDENE